MKDGIIKIATELKVGLITEEIAKAELCILLGVSKCSCDFQNCDNWERVITTCKDCKKPIK